MRVRNLRGGIFYRPIDTPAGPMGWCGEIFYERNTSRRRYKYIGIRLHEPPENESVLREKFKEIWEKLECKKYKKSI